MKNIKSILAIAALFTIGSVAAKRTATTTTLPDYNKPLPGLPKYDKPLPGLPKYDKPLPQVPAMTPSSANTAIERELTNIDQNLNKIKNSAVGLLQNSKITTAEKEQFMKRLEATYNSIHESITEDLTLLKSIVE